MPKPISSTIPDELFEELDEFLEKSGITKKFFIAKAIREQLKRENELKEGKQNENNTTT